MTEDLVSKLRYYLSSDKFGAPEKISVIKELGQSGRPECVDELIWLVNGGYPSDYHLSTNYLGDNKNPWYMWKTLEALGETKSEKALEFLKGVSEVRFNQLKILLNSHRELQGYGVDAKFPKADPSLGLERSYSHFYWEHHLSFSLLQDSTLTDKEKVIKIIEGHNPTYKTILNSISQLEKDLSSNNLEKTLATA